jgi:predicted acetyltransferase
VRAVYARSARRSTGWLDRPEAIFVRRLADERMHFAGVLDPEGALAGYVAFSYEMPETHGRTTLHVRELVAPDAETRRALVALVGAQADQVDDVSLTVAIDDPLLAAFADAPGPRRGTLAIEHPLGVLASGPMVRLGRARATDHGAALAEALFAGPRFRCLDPF